MIHKYRGAVGRPEPLETAGLQGLPEAQSLKFSRLHSSSFVV